MTYVVVNIHSIPLIIIGNYNVFTSSEYICYVYSVLEMKQSWKSFFFCKCTIEACTIATFRFTVKARIYLAVHSMHVVETYMLYDCCCSLYTVPSQHYSNNSPSACLSDLGPRPFSLCWVQKRGVSELSIWKMFISVVSAWVMMTLRISAWI